jgi:hypothetical protein
MDAPEDKIPWMYLAYRKVQAYERSLLPHFDEEAVSENYAPLGAALGIRFVKSDIMLPDFITRESLILPRCEFERFYKKAFSLSRRPYISFKQAEARCRRIRTLEDIHPYEFVRKVMTDLDRPMAIPDQLVLSTSYLWHEEDKKLISPVYYYNRLVGYLEELRRSNFILAPVIHELVRKGSSLIQDHTVPPRVSLRTYRTKENMIPKGTMQFSRDPDIPLSEYMERNGVLPIEIKSLWEGHAPISDRVYNNRPKTEREGIFILEVEDDTLLEILLEELRESEAQEEQQNDSENEEEFFVTGCTNDHSSNLLSGWDDSMTYFNGEPEICHLCKIHYLIFSYRIRKEHDPDPAARFESEAKYRDAIETLKGFVTVRYPERIDELDPLIGEKDIFDGSDDDLFGEGMF